MRVTASSALFALLPALIHAVSLSDMTPRAQNLPSDCEKIYDSQISGCGIPDFTTKTCTSTCAKALQAMVGPIKQACGGQGVTGQNLVVAFLANVGPQQICPDADFGGASSSAAVESTTSPSPSPTSTSSLTSTSMTSEIEASSMVQSTSLLVDTSSAASTHTRTRSPAFSGTTTATSLTHQRSHASTTTSNTSSRTTTDAAGSTSTGSSQENSQEAAEAHSGGGSPFDNEGNMFSGADSLSSTSVLVSLGIAVIVVVFLFR